MAEEPQETQPKMICLESSDGEMYDVELEIANEFITIESFIKDDDTAAGYGAATVIPLPNVSSRELKKIIEYCKNHIEFRKKANGVFQGISLPSSSASTSAAGRTSSACKRFDTEEADEFDAKFVQELSNDELKALIQAADYLNSTELLDFFIRTAANLIANKSVEFVRKFFGIVTDYTEEEERQVRAENEWAFKGVGVDED